MRNGGRQSSPKINSTSTIRATMYYTIRHHSTNPSHCKILTDVQIKLLIGEPMFFIIGRHHRNTRFFSPLEAFLESVSLKSSYVYICSISTANVSHRAYFSSKRQKVVTHTHTHTHTHTNRRTGQSLYPFAHMRTG